MKKSALSSEQFARLLAAHHEWAALAGFALRMAEIERLYRENPAELVKRAIAEADAQAALTSESSPRSV